MYGPLKGVLLRLFRAPAGPPDPPAGSLGTTEIFRASPRFLTARLLLLLLFSSPFIVPQLLLFGLFVADDQRIGASILAVTSSLTIALFLLFYFLIRLDYDMRYYVVTDRSLRIRRGALVIQESTYTFANVQNLTIHQGPIDRLVGVASVRIDTAGGGVGQNKQAIGGFHHGVIEGIENAETVRDRILALVRVHRDAGLGDERSPPMRAGAFSAAAIERLREIRDEIAALGAELHRP